MIGGFQSILLGAVFYGPLVVVVIIDGSKETLIIRFPNLKIGY